MEKTTSTSKKTSGANTRTIRSKIVDLTINKDNSRFEDYHGDSEDSRYDNSYDSFGVHSNFDELDRDNVEVPNPKVNNPQVNEEDPSDIYLRKKDFNYTMELIDTKLTSVYKLCKYISEVQQTEKKCLQKLVALDELTDSFWNVSYLTYFSIYSDFISIFKILGYICSVPIKT